MSTTAKKEPEGQPPPPPPPVKRVTIVSNKEELVASTPSERNWRGILIALLVIVAVLGLIVFSIVLLSPPDEGERIKGRKFALEDILGSHFVTPRFNGTWISESELVYRDIHGGVTLLNTDNLTTTVLMTNTSFRIINAVDFKVSYDLKYILLISEKKKVWSFSYQALYNIYEVETSNRMPLTTVEDSDSPTPQLLQLVTWSPQGNALAFVYKNDVYYKPSAKAKVIRLTETGVPGIIFNGVADWLYEEEIFKSSSGLWFSPDSQRLLVATFNDTEVGELNYPWYGSVAARMRYPQIHSLRYPKAGTHNPDVTLSVIDLSNTTEGSTELKPRDVDSDNYVTAVTWLANYQVSVVWMNRRQNTSTIAVCRPGAGYTCDNAHVQRTTDSGWVEIYQPPLFSADGTAFLQILPVLDGEFGKFKHLCHVEVSSRRVTPLTHGQFEVTDVQAWDEDSHMIYFEAVPERKPGQRHLYRVGDLNTSTSTFKTWDCLTCPSSQIQMLVHNNLSHLETERPSTCLYSKNHFSPGNRFFVHECLGPEVPFTVLVEAPSNTRVMVLDSHALLRERYSGMAHPQIKTFQVEVESGYHAQVRLYLPPGLRDYEEMQFPMVLHAGGAPGAQMVTEQWTVDWATYLASSRNFIVAQIDGRGSGFQGEKLLHEIQYHVGSVEIEDQIAVIKYLRDNLKFVDKSRVAVWGWSYGGFATAMILAQDALNVFQCGISVAPVVSWAYYDSIYAERYLGTPNVTDNYYKYYEESDVTKRAGNLKNKMFLLIHGTADDTVHYQQSMLLVKALTKEGVLFRHQTYPDEGHTFSGVQDHFYKAMESFFDDCFGPLDFEEWEIGTSFFSFKQ